jgi:predicted transcriptional regulator
VGVVERIRRGARAGGRRATGGRLICYTSDVRRFLFWGFKSSDQVLGNALGALERSVMELVWTRGEIRVRDACVELGSSVAYTTVMTTMDRLYKKRLLTRRKVGRAFFYAAAATRAEMEGAVAAELVNSLLENDNGPLPVLSSLVNAVSERDRALLEALERLVREKRRELQRKAPL